MAAVQIDLSNVPRLTNQCYLPLYRDTSRYLVLYGGAGSGKSVFAAQKLMVRVLAEQGHKFLVVRKVAKTIRPSCFGLLTTTISDWGMMGLFRVNKTDMEISCLNGNSIIFAGLDDVEKLKSIHGVTGIWIEEASELTREDFNQLDLRLRGFSRHYKQIILTFNPVSIVHWLKEDFFDADQDNSTVIKTTYLDNRFIDSEYKGVLDGLKNKDPYYYTVYALGEWGVIGSSVFNAEIVTERLLELRQQYKKESPLKGNIVCKYTDVGDPIKGTERFVPDDNGYLTIYRQPETGRPYVIGGDTAEGGHDYSVMQVIDNITGEQVAVWRGHTDTDLYAKQAYSLGWYYNQALISIEVNFDLHPVKELDRLGYHRQYKREVIDEISKVKQHKHGFRTTKVTRGPIIGELVQVVREEPSSINDLQTLEEMLTFVRNEDGRPEAQDGKHDDTVMALAIAHASRGQQRMYVLTDKPLPRSAPRKGINPFTGY